MAVKSTNPTGAGCLRTLLQTLNIILAMSGGSALCVAGLLAVNPPVAQYLPAPAAAAAPLLLAALAAAALALALLLVAAPHTPVVLYTYALLSLALLAAEAGAGGWLALLMGQAVMDNKMGVMKAAAEAAISKVTDGLIGSGDVAKSYASYTLNTAVGGAWAALTGLVLLVGAVVAVVAARRAGRRTGATHSI